MPAESAVPGPPIVTVDLRFLQGAIDLQSKRIRILRDALLAAKSQLCVLQILNPNLAGNDTLEETIEAIQRAMRYEEPKP